MLTQLRAIFDLIIQFQNAQESFFSVATEELQSRQRLEAAVVKRTEEVGSMRGIIQFCFGRGKSLILSLQTVPSPKLIKFPKL